MNKTVWIGIVVVVIVVGVWLLMRGTPPAPSLSNSGTTSAATTQPVATTNAIDVSDVSIGDMAFAPKSFTAKVGATVTWINNDNVTHTVTGTGSNIPTGFGSKDLSTGQTYSFTFSAPGTYTYHCSIHPQMTGTVVVQ